MAVLFVGGIPPGQPPAGGNESHMFGLDRVLSIGNWPNREGTMRLLQTLEDGAGICWFGFWSD